jgi:hypothetical protein
MSSTGDRAHYEQRLTAGRDGIGEWDVGQFVRQILLAGKESEKRTPLAGHVIADGPAQDWIVGLERVEDRPLGDGAVDRDAHFALDVGQCPEVRG